jgi:hypothetical protein
MPTLLPTVFCQTHGIGQISLQIAFPPDLADFAPLVREALSAKARLCLEDLRLTV